MQLIIKAGIGIKLVRPRQLFSTSLFKTSAQSSHPLVTSKKIRVKQAAEHLITFDAKNHAWQTLGYQEHAP